MFRLLRFSVLLLGVLFSVGVVARGADILAEERIGSLRIGLSEGDLMKATSCDFKHGRENRWGADGMYHQTWQCRSCGLNLGMVSDKRGGKKAIKSIAFTAPCALVTARGIRIGSTEQEVRNAYKKDWNREDSALSVGFVAGSIYGGIVFQLQNGKVNRIFLGASAE